MTKKKPLKWQSRKTENNIILPRKAWLIWKMDCLILVARVQKKNIDYRLNRKKKKKTFGGILWEQIY